MTKDRIKEIVEKLKGDVKERIGGAAKDRSKQAEGLNEEKKGQIREETGKREEAERREPDYEI